MPTVAKNISLFLLSILIMGLLVMIVLGFTLGFDHPLPWIVIIAIVGIPLIHDKVTAHDFVKWDDSMSVGIELVDSDHKYLLSIINQLETSIQFNMDELTIEKILNELIDYTKYHFEREEKLMLLNEYPDFLAHQHLHNEMIREVSKSIDAYKQDKSKTINQIVFYLKNWLIHHIKGSDREYMPYLKIKTI
ncbi:MAG: hemerythrin family protein [Methylococcales bacterium]|jgi:hemerythrin|nr:hemerythrin family protein [Methylococcales bacterium]MBT7411123.1 hemerythrin family protein [Methylococcales bacterium]